MTGTTCDLFTHNQSRSYLNHFILEFSVKLHNVIGYKYTDASEGIDTSVIMVDERGKQYFT
jgi:hypothetical protein